MPKRDYRDRERERGSRRGTRPNADAIPRILGPVSSLSLGLWCVFPICSVRFVAIRPPTDLSGRHRRAVPFAAILAFRSLDRCAPPGTPSRLFVVCGGPGLGGLPAGTLSLRNLTVAGGLAKGGNTNSGGGGMGAGGSFGGGAGGVFVG